MTEKRACTWRYGFYLDSLLERCDLDGNLKTGNYDFRVFIDGYQVDDLSFYVLP